MVSIANQPFNMLPRHDNDDFPLFPEHGQSAFSTGPMDLSIPTDAFGFQQPPMNGFEATTPIFTDAPSHYGVYHNGQNGRSSPYADDGDMRIPPSNLSTASAPSAASSNVGSPQSHHGQLAPIPEWAAPQGGLGVVSPGIVGQDGYFHAAGTEYSTEYAIAGGVHAVDDYTAVAAAAYEFPSTKPPGFVDPSLIHPDISRPMGMPYDGAAFPQPASGYPGSPSVASSPQPLIRHGSQSPAFLHGGQFPQPYGSPFQPPVDHARQASIMSPYPSTYSADNHYSDNESKEKSRCPHPDCGKTFKDLKAHMLTHQTERPEKCPIQTCDYHIKGFARKYDKNRHTLTHYKGTMVCGFCPGSGSAAEKSFNRADVFKRHLTAVHGVEQTPPNSRKKTGASLGGAGKKLAGYPPDATGKCSTCTQTFSNAQDFYEHLDDCVLRIVQQEDPAEAINAQRLAEVEHDKDVHQTLEKNNLPLTTQTASTDDGADDDEDMAGPADYDEEESADEDALKKSPSSSRKKSINNPANGVQKSRGMTHSRGGVPLPTKNRGRKNRRDYPSSWGFDKGQMTMKKRVMAVFDGQRRLAKDDMMLSTDHEVRVRLGDGKSYVTDLDVQTMKRAEGFLGATDEEKGLWCSDDPTEEEMQRMLEHSHVAA